MKNDSEQSAAELDLKKVCFLIYIYIYISLCVVFSLMLTKTRPFMLQLGIRPQNYDLIVDEAW